MANRRRLTQLIKAAVPLLKRQILVDAVDVVPVSGEVPVIELAFPGSERLPIYVTDAGSQLLCISYLWRDDEVKPRLRAKLLETLLDLNPSVPLSSFGRIGEHFVLVGALSPAASPADMALELATLGDNGRDALTTLAEFLV
ncbi:YjfI family protein [Tahibacter caeni]|uniref:YjfI family protein n=1 Tax=Tahibacter caeni TaxID=1453545 RepID=UPI002147F90B|nr:YjfI family protein [Tahibacter caeni]